MLTVQYSQGHKGPQGQTGQTLGSLGRRWADRADRADRTGRQAGKTGQRGKRRQQKNGQGLRSMILERYIPHTADSVGGLRGAYNWKAGPVQYWRKRIQRKAKKR